MATPRSNAPSEISVSQQQTLLSDAEYKDTVLFLQQQQTLNHQEVMQALRSLSDRISRGTAPTESRSRQNERAELSLNARDIASYTQPAPSSRELRDAELEAARARIADLESQVVSLQNLLDSKEKTIQRLSEAALADVMSRVGSVKDSARSLEGAQPRAVVQHRDSVHQLLQLTPQGVATAKDLLEMHDRRCQQLINSSPFQATSAKLY